VSALTKAAAAEKGNPIWQGKYGLYRLLSFSKALEILFSFSLYFLDGILVVFWGYIMTWGI
jgi:hypothetical protein